MGAAGRRAARLAAALAAAGCTVTRRSLAGDGVHRPVVAPPGAAAIVAIGGDGTVRACAEAARDADAPLHHAPAGTENLFARHFGMRGDPEDVLARLRGVARAGPRRIDLGRANDRPFLLMASVGTDAAILHRAAQARRRGASRAAYLPHVLAEATTGRPPRLRIEVDGERVVDGDRGLVVVANAPRYAALLDPARAARLDDGRLDVVFLPAASALACLWWALRLWSGVDPAAEGAVARRAARVVVDAAEEPAPCQLDGETAGRTPVAISVACGVVPVLAPAAPRPIPPPAPRRTSSRLPRSSGGVRR